MKGKATVNGKSGSEGPKQPSVRIIVFVVGTTHEELQLSIPLGEKETIADLTKKIHGMRGLDDESFFGLYPRELLDVFREDWHLYRDLRGRRIPEEASALDYANQTLVLLYLCK